MYDETESIRREAVATINASIVTECPDFERKRLEAKYGQVWNTEELSRDFVVSGFFAPMVSVKRKSDNKKGSLLFQHMPRFYFDFQPTDI